VEIAMEKAKGKGREKGKAVKAAKVRP